MTTKAKIEMVSRMNEAIETRPVKNASDYEARRQTIATRNRLVAEIKAELRV